MNVRKISVHGIGAALIGGMALVGLVGTAVADEQDADVVINANANANVCSVLLSTNPSPAAFILQWNGTAWPTNAEFDFTLSMDVKADGGPGDRLCYINAENTDFDSATDVMLLPADALRVTNVAITAGGPTANLPVSPATPLDPNAAAAELDVPVSNAVIAVDFTVFTEDVEQTAPDDMYTSTITVTLSETDF